MQAIARVNRVYGDKPSGLVVDYLGIASDLKQALSFYSEAGGKGDPTLVQEQAVRLMLEKIEVVSAMYHGFAYEDYFVAETSQKLSMILAVITVFDAAGIKRPDISILSADGNA